MPTPVIADLTSSQDLEHSPRQQRHPQDGSLGPSRPLTRMDQPLPFGPRAIFSALGAVLPGCKARAAASSDISIWPRARLFSRPQELGFPCPVSSHLCHLCSSLIAPCRHIVAPWPFLPAARGVASQFPISTSGTELAQPGEALTRATQSSEYFKKDIC